MSILRDIRLVAAQHLSLSTQCRAAFVNLLNELDMELDREGYDPGASVKEAFKKFETTLLDIEDVRTATNEEELFDDDVEFVDISEIDFIDPDTEED